MRNYQGNPGRAFSLIELLLVVTIIAVLSGIAVTAFGTSRRESQGSVCGDNLKVIQMAKDSFDAAHPGQAPSAADLLAIMRRDALPACPAGGNYTLGNATVSAGCSLNGDAAVEPAGGNATANGFHDLRK